MWRGRFDLKGNKQVENGGELDSAEKKGRRRDLIKTDHGGTTSAVKIKKGKVAGKI